MSNDSEYMINKLENSSPKQLTEISVMLKPSEVEHFDVIIIGAGLAGLSAGYHLKKADKDLKILIIEAKDRVGGRTQTIKLKCSKEGVKKEWDVGGQFVSDTQKHVVALLKEFNISTYKQYDTGVSVLEAGGNFSTYKTKIPKMSFSNLIDLQLLMMKVNRLCQKASTLDPFITPEFANEFDTKNAGNVFSGFTSGAKGVFATAFRAIYGLEPLQINGLYAAMYVNSGGGSMEAISLTEKDCAQEKRVVGGTQQISQKLLDSILADPKTARIIFEAPLVEVNQEQADKVFIKISNLKASREEIFSCTKLISAVPINQYPAIKFTPDLPFYKQNFFNSCRIGNYVKTIITYKKSFWIVKGFSGIVLSDGTVFNKNIDKEKYPKYGPVSTVWDGTTQDGEPALVIFTCGDPAVEWLDTDYEFRKREVISTLVRYFGPEAANYVDYYEKNWNSEPYNGGCPNVSVIASGAMKDFARATREPFLNFHLCGTETATQWIGYMDGAIESGIRAANEVAYLLSKTNSNIKYDYSKTYYHQNEEICRLKALYKKKNQGRNFTRKLMIFCVLAAVSGYFGAKYYSRA